MKRTVISVCVWSRAILLTAALTSVLYLAGCGNETNHLDGNRYANDGYMGISNSNPNFRTNPSHHNYSKDQQLMRQALREMGLDKNSTIFINGPRAMVTIHMNEELDPREAAAIRSDAYLLLKGNAPRYDYFIRFE
jgi:hypothetical protein